MRELVNVSVYQMEQIWQCKSPSMKTGTQTSRDAVFRVRMNICKRQGLKRYYRKVNIVLNRTKLFLIVCKGYFLKIFYF